MILPCTCKHEYQDSKYGKDRRVHNKTEVVRGGASLYRCTVCKKERAA